MANTDVISKLTPELDAKRTKRTGLQIEYFQPRPPARGTNLGDCAIRSACWATGESWESVYKEMQDRTDRAKSRPQNILKAGTPLNVIKDFYRKRGWVWVETKGRVATTTRDHGLNMRGTVAERENVLFKAKNLPKQLCVAITTQHAVAVEDHVVLDSYDSRGDRSCVLEGFFIRRTVKQSY